jgi:hypothetical protein
LAVVRTEAEIIGVAAVETIPEDLIDYSNTTPAETPGCDRDPDYRTVDVAGTVGEFGEVRNVEGEGMIVETAQCNRARSMTRRTTHLYPMRIQSFGQIDAEQVNVTALHAGIRGTLTEASACADPTLIASMQLALQDAETAFAAGQFALAQLHAEQLARFAKETVDGFDMCPIPANDRGNIMARALTLAFTYHDRFENASTYELYLVPADLEVPLLASRQTVSPVDRDGDGVLDNFDVCPGTVIPEGVPTKKLKNKRWALTDGDFLFDTVITGNGKGSNRSYTTADTAGCSCEQIIVAQGIVGKSNLKNGCSSGVMDAWIDLVRP